MAREEQYLVRGGDGRMRTIMARSIRGAARIYADQYPIARGEIIEVKKRGEGDWEAFQVKN